MFQIVRLELNREGKISERWPPQPPTNFGMTQWRSRSLTHRGVRATSAMTTPINVGGRATLRVAGIAL